MLKVIFVCLGNICRSPMGEFMFKDCIEKAGLADRFSVTSAGTSAEEEGNPVYPPARAELSAMGISCAGKRARKFTARDYRENDFVLAMGRRNAADIVRIAGGDPDKKVFRLLDFSKNPRDIADPWYTGNFSQTREDIGEGIAAFLQYLKGRGLI